jgi:cytochrome c-type biogenesis protein CcmH/NrfG
MLGEQANADEQAQTLIKIAEIKAAMNDISGAQAAYTDAMRRSPLNADAGIAYTQFLISQNQLPEARVVIGNARRIDPENLRGRILQVVVQSRLGNAARATALANSLLTAPPPTPRYGMQLADALRTSGNNTAARRVLFGLVERDPANIELQMEVANFARDTGDREFAAMLYRRILRIAPDQRERVLREQSRSDTSRSSQAQQDLKGLLSTIPQDPPAETLLTLAAEFARVHNYEMALQFLEEALSANPQEPVILRRIAETRVRAKIWNRMVAGYDRPPATNP